MLMDFAMKHMSLSRSEVNIFRHQSISKYDDKNGIRSEFGLGFHSSFCADCADSIFCAAQISKPLRHETPTKSALPMRKACMAITLWSLGSQNGKEPGFDQERMRARRHEQSIGAARAVHLGLGYAFPPALAQVYLFVTAGAEGDQVWLAVASFSDEGGTETADRFTGLPALVHCRGFPIRPGAWLACLVPPIRLESIWQ